MDIKALREKQKAVQNSGSNLIKDENTSSLDAMRNLNSEMYTEGLEIVKELNSVANSYSRLAHITRNIDDIIMDLETQIDKATGLNKTDIKFLFFATALQCIRQYCLTDFKPPLSDQEAAKRTIGHHVEHSFRNGSLYHPTKEMIITSPVPYDAMIGSGDFDLGLSGRNHRLKTLGHDPVLGWVFGTMNILTSTLTNNKFNSYHIRTDNKRDIIKMKADMGLIIKYSTDRLLNEGWEGKECVAIALAKQYIHMCSDIPTKNSLPIPIVATLSEEAAIEIAKAGINLGSVITVGKQAVGTTLINSIIAAVHGFCNDGKTSSKLHEVKTRKIISYSNVIASTSNVIYVAMSSALGNQSAWRKFDVGGLIVTIYRLFNDKKFIKQVEEEFLRDEMYNKIINC